MRKAPILGAFLIDLCYIPTSLQFINKISKLI